MLIAVHRKHRNRQNIHYVHNINSTSEDHVLICGIMMTILIRYEPLNGIDIDNMRTKLK